MDYPFSWSWPEVEIVPEVYECPFCGFRYYAPEADGEKSVCPRCGDGRIKL